MKGFLLLTSTNRAYRHLHPQLQAAACPTPSMKTSASPKIQHIHIIQLQTAETGMTSALGSTSHRCHYKHATSKPVKKENMEYINFVPPDLCCESKGERLRSLWFGFIRKSLISEVWMTGFSQSLMEKMNFMSDSASKVITPTENWTVQPQQVLQLNRRLVL